MRYSFLILFVILIFSNISIGQNIVISGIILSSDDHKPMPWAHLKLKNQNTGTISNAEGLFSLSVPKKLLQDSLEVDYMGFKTYTEKLENLLGKNNLTILLEPDMISLSEVVITAQKGNVIKILYNALKKIPENYHSTPRNLKAFYREVSRLDFNEVSSKNIEIALGNGYKLAEAYIDIYKPGYDGKNNKEEVKLIKGRIVDPKEFNKNTDTLINYVLTSFNMEGGPLYTLEYDLDNFTDFSFLRHPKKYNYDLKEVTRMNGRDIYVIQFDQKPEIKKCLSQGTIYIETESLAITSIVFRKSKKNAQKLEKHSFFGVDLRMKDWLGQMEYQQTPKGWVLKHIKVDMIVNIHTEGISKPITWLLGKEGKLMRNLKLDADFKQILELSVSEISEKTQRFDKKERFTKKDQIKEEMKNYDAEFWKNYNIILPERDIQ
ncbi:MAG: hypothetical protein C0594_00415 [Marinilabiliales bacterium]|nr:MAG: hypothetical protein C0594_00415 [Marinilabiliales bacterium]